MEITSLTTALTKVEPGFKEPVPLKVLGSTDDNISNIDYIILEHVKRHGNTYTLKLKNGEIIKLAMKKFPDRQKFYKSFSEVKKVLADFIPESTLVSI